MSADFAMFARLAGSRLIKLATNRVSVARMTTVVKLGIMTGSVVTAIRLSSNSSFSSMCEAKQADVPVVYQYQICPFCHRVKAYLDFLKVDYEAVEVNPLTKSEISFSDYKKVPIAVMDNATLTESGVIIQHITQQLGKSRVPESFFKDSEQWLEWSEKKLAVMLYPNITRSFDESWECFSYANDVQEWSAVQRLLVRTTGPAAMFFANGRIKKKYNIVDERSELMEVLSVWANAVGNKKFLHGDEISLADLMVFGTLRAIRNFQTFREIMSAKPELKTWFDNVDALTQPHEVCKLK